LIVIHHSKESVLLRGRDELGPSITILPYGHDIAGETRPRSAALQGSVPGKSLLRRSVAIQPGFKEYDNHLYVLDADLSSLVSMDY
jgi:hypothetical protein